jgi:outer membrane protein OmpA-like peptidoglycan-associated protein
MTRNRKLLTIALLGACGLAGLPAGRLAADPPASGEALPGVITDQQIERALRPPAQTRSFTPRGLTRRDSPDAGQSVNLNIPFAHNSSELKAPAAAQLQQLESALKLPSLASDRFVVAGHTDAKGSAVYNKQLSLKRAEAVKRYLVGKGIDAGRLDTVGYGSERLLTPDNPQDPSNRRVEIRDLGRPVL